MKRRLLALAFLVSFLALASPPIVAAKPSSKGGSASSGQKTVHVKGYTKKDGTHVDGYDRKAPSHTKESTPASTETSSSATRPPARDSHGRILRSEAAKHAFEAQTGYPHGRQGYVVDHIVPLACGGADDTSNMQWQTTAEGKAKDKWERAGCK